MLVSSIGTTMTKTSKPRNHIHCVHFCARLCMQCCVGNCSAAHESLLPKREFIKSLWLSCGAEAFSETSEEFCGRTFVHARDLELPPIEAQASLNEFLYFKLFSAISQVFFFFYYESHRNLITINKKINILSNHNYRYGDDILIISTTANKWTVLPESKRSIMITECAHRNLLIIRSNRMELPLVVKLCCHPPGHLCTLCVDVHHGHCSVITWARGTHR